uniref:Uncharacterized protein n=1 Tax=Eutreptiella gymnastica TaxID=73025 RepID=A0A7S4FSK7_9EUGL
MGDTGSGDCFSRNQLTKLRSFSSSIRGLEVLGVGRKTGSGNWDGGMGERRQQSLAMPAPLMAAGTQQAAGWCSRREDPKGVWHWAASLGCPQPGRKTKGRALAAVTVRLVSGGGGSGG